ncbi:MAG: aldo/keto reductase [Actinomycetota bacterium]
MTNTAPLTARRQLGAGGPLVAPLALGTMTFGAETPEADAHAQLDLFVDAGGNHIDTADVYGPDGASESIIGRWLAARGRTDDLIIATKGRFGPPLGSTGASRRSLELSLNASLARLGLDAVDLYYVHGWDPHTPLIETLDALSTIVRSGRARHIGWSNCTGWQLARIVTLCEAHGFVRPVAFQPQYNLLDRGIEWEVMPFALDADLGLAPWSPLGGGWLTGKYTREDRPTGATRLGEDPERGVEAYDARNNEKTWRVLDVVDDIASARGVPWGHVALTWVAGRPGVATVLLGARTTGQLVENLAATSFELSADERRRLDNVSAPGLPPYPYGMIEQFCEVSDWARLATRPSSPGGVS